MRVGEPIFWERESREIFSECHDKRRIIRFQAVINHILLSQVNINSFERLDLVHLEIFIWVSVLIKNIKFSFHHNNRDEHIEWGGGGNQA